MKAKNCEHNEGFYRDEHCKICEKNVYYKYNPQELLIKNHEVALSKRIPQPIRRINDI